MPATKPADLWALLSDPRRISSLENGDVPPLLGALEELRALLWARLRRAQASPASEVIVDAGDQILTVAEVAKELRFTRGYVYEAIRRSDLPAVRKGKYVRIRRSDVRAWLSGQTSRGQQTSTGQTSTALDVRSGSTDSARHAKSPFGPGFPSSMGGSVPQRLEDRPAARNNLGQAR